MTELSWAETRRRVFERADGCCEYCQTSASNTGQPMHTEHIIPDGNDALDNLCLACANCNFSKGSATEGIDPETEQSIALFNPRQQIWHEHFEWLDGNTRLQGKTPTGRATINRLRVNREIVIVARRNWVRAGTHPP